VLLTVRPARPEDASTLAELYGRTYGGGYSASFDRYGPIKPRDFWWIQSEKEVELLEVNGRPAGLLLLARQGKALVVEEAVGDSLSAEPSREEQAIVARLGTHLRQHARAMRAERLLLRTPEHNPLGLALAACLEMPFAHLLVVTSLHPKRQTARPPQGYALRRGVPADGAEIARIVRESSPTTRPAEEVAQSLERPEVHAWVAERSGYVAGFLLAEAHVGGFGDIVAGVREAHRRRGLGRALAAGAMSYFAARQLPVVGLHWGADGVAGAFYRALGFATERVYLFFERAL